MRKTIKTYSGLKQFKTFTDRYNYLQLKGVVGESTFGFDRYLNQILYKSKRWRQSRDKVIIRDDGNDLGIEGYEIAGNILVHHINPITIEDVELERDIVFDPEYLISTSISSHNAIHFGDENLLPKLPVERKRNDTCPWRQ